MNQRKRLVIAFVVIALATAACGTRVDKAKFFRDLADTNGTADETLTDIGSGRRYTPWKRINRKCKSYTLRFDMTSREPNERVDDIEFEMHYEPGLREP